MLAPHGWTLEDRRIEGQARSWFMLKVRKHVSRGSRYLIVKELGPKKHNICIQSLGTNFLTRYLDSLGYFRQAESSPGIGTRGALRAAASYEPSRAFANSDRKAPKYTDTEEYLWLLHSES